jgi:hypothetical protein
MLINHRVDEEINSMDRIHQLLDLLPLLLLLLMMIEEVE